MAKWKFEFTLKDLLNEGQFDSPSNIPLSFLHETSTEIAKRLNLFIEENLHNCNAYDAFMDVMFMFERLSKEPDLDVERFDNMLDVLYDTADDYSVWVR